MIDINEENLTNSSVVDLERGYSAAGHSPFYTCLFCQARFEEGMVYPSGSVLMTAKRAVHAHVEETHGGAFKSLLALGKDRTGISEIQAQVLTCEYDGLPDRDIAKALGGKSESTIRNHRFQLRRQKAQATVFLALMNLLEARVGGERKFMEFHGEVPVRDDRIVVTAEEQEKILRKYFTDEDQRTLSRFPGKQKEKLVVLNRITEFFDNEKRYTEKEINSVLAGVHGEYVTIRRYLIDYGFLKRKPDGSEYRRA